MPLPSLAYALGGLPAAALGVYADGDHRLRAIEAGFQQHVVKRVEPAILAETLARLVRRG